MPFVFAKMLVDLRHRPSKIRSCLSDQISSASEILFSNGCRIGVAGPRPMIQCATGWHKTSSACIEAARIPVFDVIQSLYRIVSGLRIVESFNDEPTR
jgi:hypothetical protein